MVTDDDLLTRLSSVLIKESGRFDVTDDDVLYLLFSLVALHIHFRVSLSETK